MAGSYDKLSVSMPLDIVERVRRIGFFNRLSESSIVEASLASLNGKGDEAKVVQLLRRHGASLRRRLDSSANVRTSAARDHARSRNRTPAERLAKMSMNVHRELGSRLRRLAFDARLSESSIVEVALRVFLAQSDDDQRMGEILRRHGATLRRR